MEIERRAGRAFADVGLPEVAADDPGSVAWLARFADAGRAWVAVDADDRPVAYLLTTVLDGATHIEQVSVDPDHARHGIGAALIEHAAARAREEGHDALTLTTFRAVPWNAPYYERLGFAITEDLGPELAARVRHEMSVIPSDAQRVTMRRAL